MTANALFALIVDSRGAGVLALLCPGSRRVRGKPLPLIATLANLVLAAALFPKQMYLFGALGRWASALLSRSGCISSAASSCWRWPVFRSWSRFTPLRSWPARSLNNQFYAYLLLSLALANGAVLADNLVLMLFFWEGLLLTLFGMIIIGHRGRL